MNAQATPFLPSVALPLSQSLSSDPNPRTRSIRLMKAASAKPADRCRLFYLTCHRYFVNRHSFDFL